MDTSLLAKELLRLVGSEKNVKNVVHCATRLRFSLFDDRLVDVAAIEQLDGVITTVNSADQFQIVIGNRVAEVYQALPLSSLKNGAHPAPQKAAAKHTNPLAKLVDIVSSIFTPLLGAMAAAGMLKGLLTIATTQGWLHTDQSTYIILHATSDSAFYFLPLMLAATAAKKFEGNIFVAIAIAGALVYPSLQELFARQVAVTFFGIPVVMMKYSSTVLPIILSIYLMCKLEHLFNKYIHETLRYVLNPFLLLVIMVPLTLLTIGPIGLYSSEVVAKFVITAYNVNPVIASALFAALYQVLVIFGMHWIFTPVIINDITSGGRSVMKAATLPSVIAQAGAVFGVMLKTKNKKMKTLAGSALISALIGITEPAIYGVTLKLKTPFICAVVAAGIGGGVLGYANSAAIATGISGLLTLPIFYGEGFIGLLVGTAISFVLAAVFTYLVGFKDPIDEDVTPSPSVSPATTAEYTPLTTLHSGQSEEIKSPIAGHLVALEQVNDKVFSSGIVGDGIAIQPANGKVYAPVNGIVTATFDSGHALQILSDSGAEVLIHIGLDTVKLDGEHYTMHVVENQEVKYGDMLIEFDLAAIEQAGFDCITPVIITNSDDYKTFQKSISPDAKAGDVLLTLS